MIVFSALQLVSGTNLLAMAQDLPTQSNLVPRHSLLAHNTWREISCQRRHNILRQVKSREREENAWVQAWVSGGFQETV